MTQRRGFGRRWRSEERRVGKECKTGEKQGSARFRSLKEASMKSPLCYEIISQPQAPLCDNFRSCEVPSWHTSTISQHSSPHFAAAKWAAKTTLDIPLFFIKTGHLSCQKGSERKNTRATIRSLSYLSPKPCEPPAITSSHFLQSAMARTRGAKSSFLFGRKRVAREAPVQGSTSEPPRQVAAPPPAELAPLSPPARRYQTRSGGRPPQKRAKVVDSEPKIGRAHV